MHWCAHINRSTAHGKMSTLWTVLDSNKLYQVINPNFCDLTCSQEVLTALFGWLSKVTPEKTMRTSVVWSTH